MVRVRRWTAALLVVAMATACGGGDEKSAVQQAATSQPTVAAAATTAGTASAGTAPTGTPAATPTGTAVPPSPTPSFDYKRFEKYIPADKDLPDRVSYVGSVDLSNEAAANDDAELKMFRDSGRQGGIQFFFSIEAGARNVSIGISYYTNPDEPKKILRQSGDPANTTAQGRFTVPGLGDEYIAAKGQAGSGEEALQLINLAWVRGPFFMSMFDVGGTADKTPDIAIRLATLIDEKLKTDPKP